MENQILININDSSKVAFFIELIKNFDFVSIKEIITNDEIEGAFKQTDEEIIKGIKQAVKEINLVKKGKLKARPVKDLLGEL